MVLLLLMQLLTSLKREVALLVVSYFSEDRCLYFSEDRCLLTAERYLLRQMPTSVNFRKTDAYFSEDRWGGRQMPSRGPPCCVALPVA